MIYEVTKDEYTHITAKLVAVTSPLSDDIVKSAVQKKQRDLLASLPARVETRSNGHVALPLNEFEATIVSLALRGNPSVLDKAH